MLKQDFKNSIRRTNTIKYTAIASFGMIVEKWNLEDEDISLASKLRCSMKKKKKKKIMCYVLFLSIPLEMRCNTMYFLLIGYLALSL